MAGSRVELQDQHLQQAPSLPCLEPGALTKPAQQGHSPAWLCTPGSALSAAAPASLEHREAPFHPSPRGGSSCSCSGWQTQLEVSQHCNAPLSHACHIPCGVGAFWQPPWMSLCPIPLHCPWSTTAASLQASGQIAQSRWTQGISGEGWDVICMQKMAYSSFSTLTNSSSALCLPSIPLLHLGSVWGKQ